MAELVWPSELYDPYQFDLDNPDSANITSCTYDDGITVWDIVNGGTTTFDSANQLGSTAPNGERISATWSTSKPANIDDNPFSILLTEYNYILDNETIVEFDINGGANDYSDIIAWGNARKNSATHEIANCYGIQYLTSDFDHRTDFLQNFTIRGVTGEFKGDLADSDIAVITRDPSYTSWLFDDRTQRGNYENIIIDAGVGYVFYSYYKGANFKRVGIKCGHNYGLYSTALIEQTFIECVIENPNSHALYVLAGKTNFIDSIARGNASSYGQLRIRGGSTSLHIVNSLVESQNPSSKAIATQYGAVVTGGNTVTNDDSAVTFGVGTEDANLSTYFDANGQINQTGQTALTGQGWNGSDIVVWAYADTSGVEQYNFTSTLTLQLSMLDAIRKQAEQQASININFSQSGQNQKYTTHNGAVLLSVDLNGNFNKLAGFESFNYDGEINLTNSIAGDFNKLVSYSGQTGLNLSLESDYNKLGSHQGQINITKAHAGSFTKASDIIGVFNLSLGLSGAFYTGDADLYTYTLRLNGVIIEQKFNGSQPAQKFSGSIPSQTFIGQQPSQKFNGVLM